MKIEGKITFKYKSKKDAKLIFDSLDVDNEGFLESKLDEENIEYTIINDAPGSFLSTTDDLIASEIVSENIIKTTKNEKYQ